MSTKTSASVQQQPPSRRGAPRSVRPLLTRLHFYAGVLVAPFIFIAALSGLLYALSPQLEQVVHHDEIFTDSRGETLPLDEQVAAAQAEMPDLPVVAVRPPVEEGMTTRVLFDDGRMAQSRRHAVFVDPVDGDIHGELTSYGGSGALPVRTWIDELHRGLHLGEPGRLYSELAASWLWVIALAGLALWWTGRRRCGGSADRRSSSRLLPHRSGSPRRRTLSWHGAVGTWIVLGMLVLSVTGLTWSRFAGANVTELREDLSWTAPLVASEVDPSDPTEHDDTGHEGHSGSGAVAEEGPVEGGIPVQDVWDAAAAEGLEGPVEITWPAGEGTAYVVQQIDDVWPTRADAASINPADGSTVDIVRFDDHPLMAKLATWGIDLHMGLLFGIWNQIALVLIAVALMAMVVWGYRMWWQRRPTRGSSWAVGRPARRGAWHSAPPWSLVLLVITAVVVGWFLPMLGWSLLAFVVLDAVIGLVRSRRSAPRGPRSGVSQTALADAATTPLEEAEEAYRPTVHK